MGGKYFDDCYDVHVLLEKIFTFHKKNLENESSIINDMGSFYMSK